MLVSVEHREPVYPCMGECGRYYPRCELVIASHDLCRECFQSAIDLGNAMGWTPKGDAA